MLVTFTPRSTVYTGGRGGQRRGHRPEERTRALFAAASLMLAAASCKSEPPPARLSDTEGRVFELRYAQKPWVPRQTSGPQFGTGSGPLHVRTLSRLMAACNGDPEGGAPPAENCRALVCSSDRQCPPVADTSVPGTCISGLCVDPSRDIQMADAILLCLAGTGLGKHSPAQADRYALAVNCGTPCQVPTPCRQP